MRLRCGTGSVLWVLHLNLPLYLVWVGCLDWSFPCVRFEIKLNHLKTGCWKTRYQFQCVICWCVVRWLLSSLPQCMLRVGRHEWHSVGGFEFSSISNLQWTCVHSAQVCLLMEIYVYIVGFGSLVTKGFWSSVLAPGIYLFVHASILHACRVVLSCDTHGTLTVHFLSYSTSSLWLYQSSGRCTAVVFEASE